MKRFIINIAILLSALTAASCMKNICEEPATGSGTEGVAMISFNMPEIKTRAIDADAYPWKNDCDIRIYKKSGEKGKELVRHYFGLGEMPSQMWLLQGDYVISVSLGDKSTATFDHPSHYGESEFKIEAGKSTDVAVKCDLLNTIVEVSFDEKVLAAFDKDFRAIVMVADEFSLDGMTDDNSLTYTESKRGYFIMPENADKLSFCFWGHSSDPGVKDKDGNEDPAVGEIHEHFTKSIDLDKRAGYLYRLKFTYSEDAKGHLTWDFTVALDQSEDESESFFGVNPSPKPSFGGDEWDISTTVTAYDELRYSAASTSSPLKSIKIESGEQSFNVDLETVSFAATSINGIEIEKNGDDLSNITLVLKKAFFDNFTGGEHTLIFTVTTQNGAENTARSKVRMQGTYSLESTDKWYSKGQMKAHVYQKEASNVTIKYRKKAEAGEWKTLSASQEDDTTWKSEEGDGIDANTEYEYQLFIDGEAAGAIATATTGDGAQVYNFDFENWGGIAGDRNDPLRPYIDINSDQWWDSGNEGSKIARMTLTENVTDIRPDSKGTYAAKLSSKVVLSTLAAGNIFLGKFVGTKNTTKGVVRFGQKFTFDYKPKELRFWFKGQVGEINSGSGAPGVKAGDKDTQQIYVLLCNMPGPHIVDTSDESTFLNLTDGITEISYCSTPISQIGINSKNDATGHVIAWGVWENQDSFDRWFQKSIELHYNEKYANEKPTWLMITAAANKYGDYYMGCSTNVIYLDDMEFVY